MALDSKVLTHNLLYSFLALHRPKASDPNHILGKSADIEITHEQVIFTHNKGGRFVLAHWVDKVLIINTRPARVSNGSLTATDIATMLHHMAMDLPFHDKLLLWQGEITEQAKSEALLISATRGI